MANLRAIYKKKTVGFGNINERRIIRAAQQTENRRDRRSADYSSRRIAEFGLEAEELEEVQPSARESQPEDRRNKLLKWKAEKELHKKIAMQKKLPAFRTGVIHHKFNSPQFLHQAYPIVKPKPITPRITRATAKRIAEKKNATTNEHVPAAIPKKAPKPMKTFAKNKTLATSFAPKNYKFTAPEGLPNLPLFGPEAVDEVKTKPKTLPIYFSPYVVTTRGKEASRKEQLQNIESKEFGLSETESKETEAQATAISDRSDVPEDVPLDCASVPLTTSHFRRITEKEVVRLKALCDHWMEIKTDDKIPEDAQLLINQTIGQTNLLINKKMEQFRQLIVKCETGCGEQLVTCQDLQGFWEMMYMQVENCDSRFDTLVRLQERNWEEENPVIATKVIPAKKPAANKKVVPSKSSSVRDMIRAARKKQMESQKGATENLPVTIVGEPTSATPGESARLSAIKFDGGFFVVESPNKIITPRSIGRTPKSQQPVFSDDAGRRSALNLLRLSQRLKPPEAKPVTVETDPTILYVNSQQIPCKSILKRADANETASGFKRSQNKVIFSKKKETPENNLSWLGESPNVMSNVQEIVKHATIFEIKKKLDLSDDSDVEEAEDLVEQRSETSCNQRVNLSEKKVLNNSQNVVNQTSSDSETNGTKQDSPSASAPLREEKDSSNRQRSVRRTRQGVIYKRGEEMVPEFSNFQVTDNEPEAHHPKAHLMLVQETDGHQKENERPEIPEETKRKRSSRKSVRFTGEECTACAEAKPVYPLTPRVNRRSSKLLETQNVDRISTEHTTAKTPSSQESEDLISWDTPTTNLKTPPRVRRSLRLQNKMQL